MRRVLRAAGLLTLAAAGAFAGVCAFMFIRQASFVYFPEPRYNVTPAALGLAFEPARLRTSDGVTLAAWWIPADHPRGAVVLAHGNGGNMSHRLDKAAWLRARGLSVLLFDYRGYGGSTGTPTEAGTYADLDAALDYLASARAIAPARTILYGESLGGAVAIEAATRRPAAGAVLESCFTSLRAMSRHYYPLIPTVLLRIRYDSLSRIGGVRCPLFVMHSPEDDIVPYAMGRALFDAAKEPKRFAGLAGGHNSGGILRSQAAQLELERFLGEVLPPEGAP